jgi:hypothetical protein
MRVSIFFLIGTAAGLAGCSSSGGDSGESNEFCHTISTHSIGCSSWPR